MHWSVVGHSLDIGIANMKLNALALAAIVSVQMAFGCKNCIILSKYEREMFRTHAASCLPSSNLTRGQLEALEAGRVEADPALIQHVYCVLRRCKIVDKDGKLLKVVHFKNAKIAESCNNQSASSAEEQAWLMFRCAHQKKTTIDHDMTYYYNATENLL